MLDLPGIVDAEPVSEFHLLQRLVDKLLLDAVGPGSGQLMFVENAKFQDDSLIVVTLLMINFAQRREDVESHPQPGRSDT